MRKKIKTTLVYIASNIIYQLPPVLLLPFLTRYLSQADYGIVTLFTKMTALLLPICTLGIKLVTKKGFYWHNKNDFSIFFTTALLLPFISLPIVGIALWLMGDKITQWWGYPVQWLWAIPVFVACRHAFLLGLDQFRALKKPLQYALFKNGAALLEIGITVLLITTYNMTYDGRILGIIAAKMLFALLALGWLWTMGQWRWGFNLDFARHIAAEGLRALPILVASVAFKLLDTFLVAYYLGNDATGIYGLALRVASAVALVQTGLLLATQPALMEQLSKPKENKTSTKIAQYLLLEWLLFVFAAVVLAWVVVPIIFPYYIDAKFNDAITLLLPLSLGLVLLGIAQSLSTFFVFFGQYRPLNIGILVGLLTLLVSTAWAAPHYGLIGIAWASCIAYAVPVVFQLYYLPQIYAIPWGKALHDFVTSMWSFIHKRTQ